MATVLAARNGVRMRYLLGFDQDASGAYMWYGFMLTNVLGTILIIRSVLIGHVFCKECIDEATTAGRRQGRTRCPTCRAEYVGSPIKLFMSESRERPQPPREKTWAEATIPLPFFAELHLKNLREDLATTQSVLETTQRQLELSLAEKRQLLAQNRRVIAERTTAHQAREQLVEECKVLKAEKTLYLEAGRGLEASVAVLHDQSAEMRQELDNAVDTIRQLKARLERQDQREGPATNPDRDRRSKVSSSLEAMWVPV